MSEISTWGGARAGAGRKKGAPVKPPEERRTATVVVTLTPEQKEIVKAKAKAAGESVSTYLLKLALGE